MKKYIALCTILIIASSLTGMQGSYVLNESANIQKNLYQALDNAYQSDQAQIYADTFVLTDKKVATTLMNIARKKRSHVSLHMDRTNSANKKRKTEIKNDGTIDLVESRQHGKRFLIEYKNTSGQWERFTMEGSFNPTQAAAKKNAEVALFTHNDATYFKMHQKSHVAAKKSEYKGEKLLRLTPEIPHIIDTTEYDVVESLAQRIKPTVGGTLYIASMGYSHKGMHAKLMAFCKESKRNKLHILLDNSAISDKTKPMLDELDAAGAEVIIGNLKKDDTEELKNPRYRGIFHKKYLVRLNKDEDIELVVVQSANLTSSANGDFNHAAYHPNRIDLGTHLIAGHKLDCLNGMSYQDFLPIWEKEYEAKKEARRRKNRKSCCQCIIL